MHIFVFLLVLFSAFTHALWNFTSKKVSGNFTLFWFGLLTVSIILLPYSFNYILKTGFNIRALPYIITSTIAHSLYYYLLLYSYKNGDISTAYPIARGIAIAGTAIVSLFFLNESVSIKGGFGIASILYGVLLIGFSGRNRNILQKKSFHMAILTGFFIFICTVTDSIGAKLLNPVVYINIFNLFAMLILTPFVLNQGVGKSIIAIRSNFRDSMIIGIGCAGTYMLILYAFTIERTSYIVALREFSIVIASVLGFLFLKEKPTLFKVTGIALITAGLVLLKLG